MTNLQTPAANRRHTCRMRNTWRWLAASCWLFLCSLAWSATQLPVNKLADNIRFKHIMGSADGEISFSGINSMVQDSRGFMWFGGENGLIRYDGKNAVVYQHDPSNPRSLSNGFVFSLLIDHQNYLWVATDAGLNRYNSVTDDFDLFEHDPNNPNSLVNNRIHSIIETRDHSIYVATFGGLNIISPDRKTIRTFEPESANRDYANGQLVRKVFEDASGFIWIGTIGSGVERYDPQSNQIQRFNHDPNTPNSLCRNDVRDITQDKLGRIWIATDGGGLCRLNADGKTFTRYSFLNDPKSAQSVDIVFSILSDSQGYLWVALNQTGIALYNFDTDSFQIIDRNPFDPASLLPTTIKFIFEDRMGDLWIPSFPHGINFLNRSSLAFKNYYHKVNDPNSLSDSAVLHLMGDRENQLWVGTETGLNRHQLGTNQFSHYLPKLSDEKSLPANAVLALLEDSKDRFWVGNWAGGLSLFNKKTGEFTRFTQQKGKQFAPSSKHIWAFLEDASGGIWIGTQTDGLNYFNEKDQSFTRYTWLKNADSTANGGFVIALLQDKTGVFWVGTSDGLYLFDPNTGQFQRNLGNQDAWKLLGRHRVVALREDTRGDIWIATSGSGLARFTRKKNTFEFLRTTEFMPSDMVSGVMEDNQGYVWASTTKGLVKINPHRFKVVGTFGTTSGIRSEIFNRNAVLKDNNGKLYFGGADGIVTFDPSHIDHSPPAPPIVFTDFKIFNLSQRIGAANSPLKKSLDDHQHLDLSAAATVFSIEFAALDYRESRKNKYAYMLEGVDKDWVAVSNHHSATYTNLDPGRYVFKVRQLQWGQPVAEGGRDLTLVIHPPTWRTWWAYVLYAGMLMLIFYWLQRVSVRRSLVQEQHRLLEQASFSDPLTQLKNRRYLLKHLPDDIAIILRHYQEGADIRQQERGKDLVFFMVDIDHFKAINDTYGHSTGDLVLAQFAQVMISIFRDSDYLVRWGGDEFLVVGRFMPLDDAAVLSERLRTKVAQTAFMINSEKSLHITCSIGFCPFPFDKDGPQLLDWQNIIDLADTCLYAAKHSGRNIWVGLRKGPNYHPQQHGDLQELSMRHYLDLGAVRVESSRESIDALQWLEGKEKKHP